MRLKVTEHIGDLVTDLSSAPVKVAKKAPKIVKRHADLGNLTAQRLARAKSGPHGKDYYKRLTSEMTGPMRAEYGPEGIPKTDFIGADFRHGVNLDLPNSADLIAPKFAKAIGDMVDEVLW